MRWVTVKPFTPIVVTAALGLSCWASLAAGPKGSGGQPSRRGESETTSDRWGGPLPPAATRLGTVRLRHSGETNAVALSPDGRLLATVGGAGEVHVWETAGGAEIAQFRGKVRADVLAFTPDGKTLLAASSAYARLQRWDVLTGRLLH